MRFAPQTTLPPAALWERLPRGRLAATSSGQAGQASRDWWFVAREVCSAKAHSRSIDSGELGRAFPRGYGGKLEGPSCRRRKVEAPDALCAADHPASGGLVGTTSSGDGMGQEGV